MIHVAEVGFGGRVVLFSTNVGDTCRSCSDNGDKAATAAWWMIAPRAGLDFWVHPNVTIGAFARVDALQTSDVTAGLTFAFHARGYDGL